MGYNTVGYYQEGLTRCMYTGCSAFFSFGPFSCGLYFCSDISSATVYLYTGFVSRAVVTTLSLCSSHALENGLEELGAWYCICNDGWIEKILVLRAHFLSKR